MSSLLPYLPSLIVLVVALVVVLGATWWFVFGPGSLPRRPPVTVRARPRLPVVLVPGFGAFDTVGPAAFAQAYFRGVADALGAAGIEVVIVKVPALGSVPERAAEVAAQIRALPHARVNVVAHSMGGLDTRYAIARLGLADRVATLVTIATPHRGTPLAHAGTARAGLWVRDTIAKLGFPSGAVEWLTPAGGERLAREAPDQPGVRYASVVCRAPAALWRKNPLLYATWIYLGRAAGENDGVVPTASQRWGEVWLELDIDHWGQIGWSPGGAHLELFAALVEHLAEADGAQAAPQPAERAAAADQAGPRAQPIA